MVLRKFIIGNHAKGWDHETEDYIILSANSNVRQIFSLPLNSYKCGLILKIEL